MHDLPVRRGSNFRGGGGSSFSQRGGHPAAPVGHHGTGPGTWDNSGGGPSYPTWAYTPSPNMNQPGLYSYAPSSIQGTSGIYYQNNTLGYSFFPGIGTDPNTHGQPMSPFRGASSGQQRKSAQYNRCSSTNLTAAWNHFQKELKANREQFPCIWCGDFYHCLLDCHDQQTTWRAPLRSQVVQSGYESEAAFFVASLQARHRPEEFVPFMTGQRRSYYICTENPNSIRGRGRGRGGRIRGSVTSSRQVGNRQPGKD